MSHSNRSHSQRRRSHHSSNNMFQPQYPLGLPLHMGQQPLGLLPPYMLGSPYGLNVFPQNHMLVPASRFLRSRPGLSNVPVNDIKDVTIIFCNSRGILFKKSNDIFQPKWIVLSSIKRLSESDDDIKSRIFRENTGKILDRKLIISDEEYRRQTSNRYLYRVFIIRSNQDDFIPTLNCQLITWNNIRSLLGGTQYDGLYLNDSVARLLRDLDVKESLKKPEEPEKPKESDEDRKIKDAIRLLYHTTSDEDLQSLFKEFKETKNITKSTLSNRKIKDGDSESIRKITEAYNLIFANVAEAKRTGNLGTYLKEIKSSP